jgi:hypothetical protein
MDTVAGDVLKMRIPGMTIRPTVQASNTMCSHDSFSNLLFSFR